MSTVSKFHRSGLGVLSIVVGLCFLAVFAQRLYATVHPDMDCWLVAGGMCNTPLGDCQWKPDNMICYKCDAARPLTSACIYRLEHTCVSGDILVTCGKKIRGKCSFGLCVGSTIVSNMCAIYPCEGAVPN